MIRVNAEREQHMEASQFVQPRQATLTKLCSARRARTIEELTLRGRPHTPGMLCVPLKEIPFPCVTQKSFKFWTPLEINLCRLLQWEWQSAILENVKQFYPVSTVALLSPHKNICLNIKQWNLAWSLKPIKKKEQDGNWLIIFDVGQLSGWNAICLGGKSPAQRKPCASQSQLRPHTMFTVFSWYVLFVSFNVQMLNKITFSFHKGCFE